MAQIDGERKHSPWKKQLRAIVLCLALTEALLRGVFLLRVNLGTPPHCGVRPEILGRLYFAYSRGRPMPDRTDQDGVVHDRQRGYHLAPNLQAREFHGAPLSTNSRGIRGTREYALPKPDSVTRIVALGDSFTFGEGVTDDATWPAQLENGLTGAEVANLGAPAYAHDQMYFALADDGMPLQPDVVILGFYANDKWRDELTFYCAEKPRFTRTATGWQIENQPVPTPWETHDYYRRLPLIYALPVALLEALTQPQLTDNTGDERATEIIDRTRRLAESGGARFVLVNLPDKPEGQPETRGLFYDYCTRTGTECVDPWPQFRITAGTDDSNALRARYQRPNDIHYSREGYAVVAETLRKHFEEKPITRVRRP